MDSYDKLTVVQLRAELKNRSIAQTGLTRKQQLIDRLVEDDAAEKSTTQEPALAQVTSRDQEVVAPDSSNTAFPSEQSPSSDVPGHLVNTNENAGQYSQAEQPPEVSSTGANIDAPRGPSEDAAENTEIPEKLAQDPSAASSPNPDELRKRKRRSATPPLSAQEVEHKRFKPDEDAPEVYLKEDFATNGPDVGAIETTAKTAVDGSNGDADGTGHHLSNTADLEREHLNVKAAEVVIDDETRDLEAKEPQGKTSFPAAPSADVEGLVEQGHLPHADSDIGKGTAKQPPERANLYKTLVRDPQASSSSQPLKDAAPLQDAHEAKNVSPSVHPATNALYIRDFMRPLQANQLKTHLTAIARPSQLLQDSEEAPENPLVKFHLDTLRSHCFAVFSSVPAASRVRTAMHDVVWPLEKMRKPLWADYVPEEKVDIWIGTEMESAEGRRGSEMKKWEVVYETLDDGTVSTELQETGVSPVLQKRMTASSLSQHETHLQRSFPSPEIRQKAPGSEETPTTQEPASFLALDKLFNSTTAKPKLYYLPVVEDRARKRLEELESKCSRRDVTTRGDVASDDNYRYTFEDGDVLVNNGPEYGLRAGLQSDRGDRRGRGGLPTRGRGWRGR